MKMIETRKDVLALLLFSLIYVSACQGTPEPEFFQIECKSVDERTASGEIFSRIFMSQIELRQNGCAAPDPYLIGYRIHTPSCGLTDQNIRELLDSACAGTLEIVSESEKQFRENRIVDYLRTDD